MSDQEKTIDQVRNMIEKVAEKQGWEANPDLDFRDTIAYGLQTNHKRHGYFLCPCRDGDGERNADKDIICPCKYAQPDIDEHGQCYCGLYLQKGFSVQGRIPQSIPERRPGGL